LTVWLGHIWATLRVALMGYGLAVAVSIPLAVALTNSRLLSRTLYPILIIIQSTPIVAIAPIIVVTLGASDMPRVLITFLITFFPIVATTFDRPARDTRGVDRIVALAAGAAHP
jgi:NitT/TauT family transport system permease protein